MQMRLDVCIARVHVTSVYICVYLCVCIYIYIYACVGI